MFYFVVILIAAATAAFAFDYAMAGSVGAVIAVFCGCLLALYRPNFAWSRGVVANATTLIVTTGIFFTFLGIFIGLQGFDIQRIDAGIDRLLDGMKVAFLSSVAGLLLSLLYRVIRILRFQETGGAGSEVNAADIHSALIANNKVFKEGFDDLADALGGDKDASVVGQLARLRTITQDKFTQLTEEFRNFAETIAENNSKALIEALSDVMRDFNTKLNEQFGENFKQLNEAVGKLVEWQENYRQQMEELKEAFEQAKDNLEKVASSVSGVEESTSKIPEHLDRFETVYKQLSSQVDELNERLEAFADMKEKAADAFPAIQEGLESLTNTIREKFEALTSSFEEDLGGVTSNLSKNFTGVSDGIKENFDDLTVRMRGNIDVVTSSLTKGIEESTEKVSAFSDTHIEALKTSKDTSEEIVRASQESLENTQKISKAGLDLVNDTAVGLETAASEYNKSILKLINEQDEEYKKLVTRTAGRMEETVQEGFSNLKNAVSQLDTEMGKEVTKAVELMGSNITSITDEFVTQYQKLIDSNRDIIE